ncbi:hypothetical protein BDQ17DRAFT_1235420 [Cyathus striatus]|nr:hypothetical protein BDQ17DRAFT_1235420 [Cyathus striatus]
MPLFTHLNAPAAPSRKRSPHPPSRDDVGDFLSSDLELSFASNVSLNSPPRDTIPLSRENNYPEPMDISPAPGKPIARPRALTSAARLFGCDISNNSENPLLPSPNLLPVPSLKSSGSSTLSSAKRIQRSALPAEWLANSCSPEASKPEFIPEPASPMDVDTSYISEAVHDKSFSSPPQTAGPTTTGFNQLFYETVSPRRSLDTPSRLHHKKRRSLSPPSGRFTGHDDLTSSPMLPSSPSDSKLERIQNAPLLSRMTSKPTLQGLGAPAGSLLKRPRRPVVSALIQPSEYRQLHSAYPIASPSGIEDESGQHGSAIPIRRAFSALLPPSVYTEHESEDSSFDGPDMSSPAQDYAKRQQGRTIRRCDGTEDFRPLTGASVLTLKDSPSAKFMAAGLPGFGDNEAHGKILPCHRVTEDGLMRITSETLDQLLEGKFEEKITDYHIIDCRFDYEYSGGHIAGAVNINTTSAVEELLLGPSLTKPRPSISGDLTRKTILVFHCEFSAKRAPTFAKHLRSRDRAMNNHVYPKIHYPEVYILEGGYCQYFKSNPIRCEPQNYVTMDDPNYASSRREDLDQFRKTRFGRHKSYAYGDMPNKISSSSQQPKRNSAPSAPQTLFAACSAAVQRRRGGGGSLMTLAEDGNVTADADDTDTDIGDSPCPPPSKAAELKGKKIGRGPLVRAETYGPSRMPF